MNRQPISTDRFAVVYLVILAVATIAAYANIFHSEVLRWDDKVYLDSGLVRSLWPENLLSILTAKHNGNWHPLTTLGFAVEHALWGTNAVYSKLVNLFLHLVNVILFFVLSRQILLLATANRAASSGPAIIRLLMEDREKFALYSSLLAATLFSLHPQHVESVAWVSERKGLLSATFYLAALITYIKASAGNERGLSKPTLIFLLCALMSKPMAISLPVAFVLLDIYPLGKIRQLDFSLGTLKTLLSGKLVYIVPTIASIVITLLYQDPQNAAVLGYLPRWVNAFAAYLHYLTSIFYPANLSPFYPFQDFSLNPSIYSIVPALVFFGLILVASVLNKKGIQFPLIVLGFYVVSLLPVIGIVKVGYQAMADRYAYLPTIWFFLLLGIAIFALYSWSRRRRLQIVAVLILGAISLFLGLTTFEQTRYWQNDYRLWERVIEVFPDSASIAYVNLAAAHHARGDMPMEQIGQLIEKAVSISPGEPYVLQAAAKYHGMRGDEQTALGYLLRITRIAPYNTWAQTTAGDIFFQRNDLASAGNFYLAAIRQGADPKELVYKLAWIDYQFQRYADALTKLEILAPAEMDDQERALYREIQGAITHARQ